MKILFVFSLVPLFFYGHRAARPQVQKMSDSVAALTFAIIKSVSAKDMPDASRIYANDQATIFLATTSLSIDFLKSSLPSRLVNVASTDKICDQLNRAIAGSTGKNYLELTRFENRDGCFDVQIRNLGCLPFSGGGSLSLLLKVMPDSVAVLERHSSSIN